MLDTIFDPGAKARAAVHRHELSGGHSVWVVLRRFGYYVADPMRDIEGKLLDEVVRGRALQKRG